MKGGAMNVPELVLGIVLGALGGVTATVTLEDPFRRAYQRLTASLRRRRRLPSPPIDLVQIGLLQINGWSTKRPLDPDRHDVIPYANAAEPQQWFPEDIWERERRKGRAWTSGEVAQVMAYTVDHGESGEASKQFRLTVRNTHYGDGVAVQRLCRDPELWAPVRDLFLSRGGAEALRVAPDQSFFVSLTLTTAGGDLLAVRRAAGTVATAGGLWSLGACETMRGLPTTPGESPEDLFDLARRAALEEFGLQRPDIGPIWYSWFGFSRTDGLMAVAHTQTSLSCDEVSARVADAEGGYEADAMRWIRVNSPEHQRLRQRTEHPGWVDFTPVVADGAARMWPTLTSPPVRR